MKFYITSENYNRLRRSFLNLKIFSIINVQDILEQYGYTYDNIDEYGSFIVNKKIMALIKTHSKSKRIRGIIYSNPKINDNIIESLMKTVEEYDSIDNIVLLDDYNVPKLTQYYDFFDEIIYFPSIKKVRLIESQSITDLINKNKK